MLELPDIPAQRSADGKTVTLLGEERRLLRFTLEPGVSDKEGSLGLLAWGCGPYSVGLCEGRTA